MPNIVRILALDLDDAHLSSDLSTSYRARNAIKRSETMGAIIVLASERIPAAMEHFTQLLGLHKKQGYLICNNGAMIQESWTGKVICEARIEPEIALAVCDLIDAEGFPVRMYEDDIIYSYHQNEYSDYDDNLSSLRQVTVENFRDMVGGGCYRLVIPGEPSRLVALQSLLNSQLGDSITVFTNRKYSLDILPKQTNKATALFRVAGIFSIKADEILAIGDRFCDEILLHHVSSPVTEIYEDEDMAAIIEKYLFDGESSHN